MVIKCNCEYNVVVIFHPFDTVQTQYGLYFDVFSLYDVKIMCRFTASASVYASHVNVIRYL